MPARRRPRRGSPRSPAMRVSSWVISFSSPLLPAGFRGLLAALAAGPVMFGEKIADDLKAALLLLDVGHVTRFFEDLPARALDAVGEGLHHGRRRLVIAAGDQQRRRLDAPELADDVPVLQRADDMEFAGT